MQRVLYTVIASTLLIACTPPQQSKTETIASKQNNIIICPEKRSDTTCDFFGENAIQQAVDSAQTGSTLILKSGIYQPISYREIPFNELIIRGFTVIENKELKLIGESGTVIDGSLGAASAFVTHNSKVTFKNINLNDFRWDIEEDDTYDGHGIFIINGEAEIDNVSMKKIQKMSLTTYGNAKVKATKLTVTDSHLGIWANETSSIDLDHSYFHGSESAAVTAYDKAHVNISDSVFEENHDDGIYASDESSIQISRSVITHNKPFGVNVDKKARIDIDYSYIADNQKNVNEKAALLRIGNNMLSHDPRENTQ
ncbi:right-handed parallel beta-helix repeat-containing protein [Dasania sp. GY-MA-18]|uniref:Right-handed parallel beta-helix repeat-containing protein n=1 Tax=Dasania phycosphaerae TaxID=2950436 RepID=A0A9J6RIU7_9GAMM|nr:MULTISPECIES: right-handed parallel beta-helix repeat-containing protein [Dasania]MCR8921861.1 right-handed parallel beta-helix repeat-containing protein [Dasania sp. GY-MA-18]MCZ0864289.1 right-handed parallel beta-helix repeat-containing protein [Dasania phycosphaerae]MCZ0868017.1 right-handed parallel beta-helix repeat-containing protein [Dasania phycosphaerae]